MTRNEKAALTVAGVLAAVAGGTAVWLFWPSSAKAADGDQKKATVVPFGGDASEAEVVYLPSTKLCGLDAQPYNIAQWPDKDGPTRVANALQTLGYSLSVVTNAKGRAAVRAFQSRARTLGLDGMKGAPDSWIDGDVGACTLRALSHAMRLFDAGAWGGA